MTSVEEKVPAALIHEAVDTAAGFFPRLIEALTRVASDLQEDRLQEGLTLFRTAQDGIRWFCNMVELRAVWLGDHPRRQEFEERWPPFIETMAAAADALGGQDYVLLSDLLVYEIVPFMEEALAIVQELGEEPAGHVV